MTDEEMKTIIESLKATRIYFGADFEKSCNEKKYTEALILQTIRDSLSNVIQIVESYRALKIMGEMKGE